MDPLKKKNKNSLECLSKEDVETLIRKCYRDKLVYGFVKWKDFNRKDFKERYSVNTFKNIWRMIKRKFDMYKKEYHDVMQEAEKEAKDIIIENKERKKKENLNILIPLNSKISQSNISLLRNFTRVNSYIFKTFSNYYSPLNSSKDGSPYNFVFPNKERLSKDKEKETKKRIDYIKRNIKDIQRRSEFLDLYFLVISLIHGNKKYALLKKMEELYYQNKLIKCCNNLNHIHNNNILYFIKKILEISLVTSNSLKSVYTKTLEKKFGSSKYIDSKNCVIVEINEITYSFNKDFINYNNFFHLFKKNLHFTCNKVVSFFIPLPKKPNHLTFKNNIFYYFDSPIFISTKLDEDIYNYIYIIHKFFLSFKFWLFYMTYQGIDKMKNLFNKEVEELNSFFEANCTRRDISKKDRNEIYNFRKNINTFLLLFDQNIQNIISLSLYAIKLYMKRRKKRDITYFKILKILNLSLHPVCKKKIMRSYPIHLKFIHSVFLKVRPSFQKKQVCHGRVC
ncbi:hypothetical protein, conserved [Plasmodium gonderi]|uniref:Uncharacterized protein n=1 Tax=Plasmodium gonderi TaxID=77519 RepID=A0A1Y1JNR2_PLAGO|nr:hypothetical protein, conserved [Plasmodium gonderi]GAW83085.1 hypothetical protein, conserved [Plasmodium gonderi]